MFNIAKARQEKGKDEPHKFSLSDWQKMLTVAVVGVVALCYLVAHPVHGQGEMAYRTAWLVLTGVTLGIMFYVGHERQELNVRRTALLVLLIVAQIAVCLGLGALREALPGDLTYGQLLLVLPYALAPSITAVMLGRKLGVYVALCTSLFGVALLPADCPAVIMADYLVISLLAGSLSAILCNRVRKREHILYAGFATGAAVFVSAVALGCFRANGLASIREGFNLTWFASEAAVTLGMGFLVAVFVGGLMPLLEKLFNISTHITWLEWADMNHPVLKKLQIHAPGTFHHCLYVQRLAEAAAEAIGADATRAGVCALYHDIGKLKNPEYFAENIADQRYSPHNELSPEASARLIVQHVQNGVELAREFNLNSRIINVIREHHGTSTAYFFYRKALDSYKEAKEKFDQGLTDTCPEEVDKAVFTYKGPVPQTKESGIVSMADAVESAVRSLVNPTEQDVQEMIDGIFKGRILDGHLQDCQLTLGDIAKMKKAFFTTLRTMNHSRIAYPKPKEEAQGVIDKARMGSADGAGEGGSKAAS